MPVTVLVADDEEAIRSMLALTLAEDHHTVLLAKDGDEALSLAKSANPDVIFLDVLMPGLSGYQVCRILKHDPKTAHIKIIMLTAMAQEADHRRAQEAGADDYFVKPFSLMALLEKINTLTLPPGKSTR